MFRNLFIIISCLAISNLAFTTSISAADSLAQINADLLAKKNQEDPFNGQKAKVDLESLGLDEIDAKDTKKDKPTTSSGAQNSSYKESTDDKFPELPDPKKTDLQKSQLLPVTSKENNTATPLSFTDRIKAMAQNKMVDNNNKDNSSEKGSLSKIQNFIQKTKIEEAVKKDPIPPIIDPNSPTFHPNNSISDKTSKPQSAVQKSQNENGNYQNDRKKFTLKRQQESKKAAKKRAEENEKKRKVNLVKLNQLRKKYLTKINNDNASNDSDHDEDLSDVDKSIIPQRKDINKFVSYETPAPPILNRYRSAENVGIPVFLSKREKTDILFRSISNEDISYFNSAYQDLEDPNLRNEAGDTILTYAILLQKRNVVASILAKGADANLANGLGYTPLQITIESLDLESFNILLNSGGVDLNSVDGFGRTYLMHAARVGFLAGIDSLIKKGIDINAMDYDGFSALAIAKKYNQNLAVALLLKNGAKPWVEKPYDPESESMIKQLENRWKK